MKIRIAYLGFALLPAALSAQTTSAASTPATPSNKEVIVLSPFEVKADSDVGYVGQNTLAGSRMRTQLKDIAAAISPMTSEFLSDIAVTNLIEASEYAVSTRAETDDGRAAGPVADGYISIRDFRVRGLPGGTRTLNFIPYFGEIDTFNTERLEINRGPNSILYGIGSPAGIINATTKQARLDRNAYSVSFRADSWDGVRTVLDANYVFLKDKLALRAVGLLGREGSWRSAGHNDQDRLHLAATWQVTPKTTVKAEFETLDQDRYVPRPFFGVDLTGTWDAAGRPSFANFNTTLPAGAVGTPGNPFRDSGTTALNGVVELRDGAYIVLSDQFSFAQNYRRFTRSEPPAGPIRNDFARGLSNPEADFQANWGGGLWDNDRVMVTVQQAITPTLNAEFVFGHQRQDYYIRDLSGWNFYGVQGDPNTFYPDGTAKPAANNLYYEMTSLHRPGFDEFDQYRATLSYEKDFGKFGKLRLAGMAERRTTENLQEILQQYLLNGADISSGGAFAANPEDGQNQLFHRYYLANEAVLNDPNYRFPAPYNATSLQVKDPATGVQRTVYAHMINRSQGNVNWFEQKNVTEMLAGQYYALKDRVVFTGGYRWDDVRRYQSNAIRDPKAVAPNVGAWIPVAPPSSPSSKFKGKTYTYGVVAHATPWMSVFYNHSNSINPPSTIRIVGADPTASDLLGLTAPLRTGVTDDYGLKFSLFSDRVYVTATRFDTQAKRDTGFSGFGFAGAVRGIWQAMRDSTLLTTTEQAQADQMFNYTAAVQGYLYDSSSKGYELEIVGEVLPGWSVSLNYSQATSVWSNVATEARAYIDQWKGTWLKYKDLNLTQSTATPGPDTRTFQDFRTPADIKSLADFTLNTDTINEQIVDLENNLFGNPFVFEGRRFIGDNKHNFNARTRFDFRKGDLAGLSLGLGMRMRRDRIAGAVTAYDLPADINSYTDKFNGRTVGETTLTKAVDQAIYDLQVTYRRKVMNKRVNWTIQLNVNNLFDEDDFIFNNTHPSTGLPVTYRYQDPRQFIVTNTFSF